MATTTAPEKIYTDAADFMPLLGTDYVELYVSNAKQAAYFYQAAMGFQPLAYAGLETGLRDRESYVVVQDRIRLVLTAPLKSGTEIGQHIDKHGDGVKVVALWVDDARNAYEEAMKRGALDYLVKPFRPRELRARADSMLRRPRGRTDVGATAPAAPPAPPVEESWATRAAREFADDAPRGGAHAARPAEPAPPAYQPPVQQQPAPVQQQPAPQQPAQQTYLQAVPGQPVPPVAAGPGGPAPDGAWIRFNGLALNNETRIVTVDGGSVDLTRTEFDLLASLLSTGRRVRSKADLVLTMRGQQYVTSYFVNEADKRSVEVHVANLRRKIGDDSTNPKFIETVRGVGYRLAESL